MNTSVSPVDPAPDSSNSLHGRLLAILAADVAGYSRLMSLDDRGTVAALDAARAVFREQILAHRGRVIDMAGDSVLAVFDTAVGAVDTALVVQQQLAAALGDTPEDRRMRFRIGIHVGDVIEKDDGSVYGDGVNIAARLEGLAEPGGVTVSRAVQGMVELRVAATFEDIGKQIVKNIAQPVWAYRLHLGAVGAAPVVQKAAPRNPNLRRVVLAGVALLILAAGIGAWQFWRPASLTASNEVAVNPLSILVLPFANQTGDAQKAYIADALTYSISADLNRIRDAFVVPTATAFTYKDNTMTVQQIGKDAAVRFVLQGSVLGSGEQLRISAQLADTLTGRQLWNETFEGNIGKLFELQDLVTTRIGNSIGPAMVIVAAQESEKHVSATSVVDLMLRVRALGIKPQSLANHVQAEAWLREALKQEPENPQALAGLAYTLSLHATNFMEADNPAGKAMLVEAQALALRAQAIDDTLPGIYFALANHASNVLHDVPAGRRFAEKRLTLEPKHPMAYNNLAIYDYSDGEPKRAIELLNKALSLYPKGNSIIFSNLGRAYLMLGDNAAALEWSQKAADAGDKLWSTPAEMAMAASNLGQTEKAKHYADEYKRRLKEAGVKNSVPKLDGYEGAPFVNYFNERYLPEWKKAGLME